MSMNRLKLNTEKTQLIWLGTRQQLTKLTVTQLQLTMSVVEFDSVVTDLGVVLDNQLSMGPQVTAVSRSCFYQLRQTISNRGRFEIIGTSVYTLPVGLLQRSAGRNS